MEENAAVRGELGPPDVDVHIGALGQNDLLAGVDVAALDVDEPNVDVVGQAAVEHKAGLGARRGSIPQGDGGVAVLNGKHVAHLEGAAVEDIVAAVVGIGAIAVAGYCNAAVIGLQVQAAAGGVRGYGAPGLGKDVAVIEIGKGAVHG